MLKRKETDVSCRSLPYLFFLSLNKNQLSNKDTERNIKVLAVVSGGGKRDTSLTPSHVTLALLKVK